MYRYALVRKLAYLGQKADMPFGYCPLVFEPEIEDIPEQEQLATIRTYGVEPTDQAVFPFPVIILYRSTQMDIGNEINLFASLEPEGMLCMGDSLTDFHRFCLFLALGVSNFKLF